MTVESEEETNLRRAGKKINKLMNDLEKKYHISDRQDALAMCVLQIATLSETNSNQNTETLDLHADKISQLSEKISRVLS